MRIIISFILAMLFTVSSSGAIAYAGEWNPKIEWHLKISGKPSSEIQIGPNGLFYVPSGNKITVFDEKGRKLQEITGNSGSGGAGAPVFDPQGSIFMPGKDMFQEIKLNGSLGWKFNIYATGGSSQALLTPGPGRLLYLHAPSGLYAVDTVGRYRWMLYQWNLAGNVSTKTETFKVIAAAGNERVVLSVVVRESGAAYLFAFDQDGELKWRFALGETKSANLVFGPDGLLYMTVNPAKATASNRGSLYAFDIDGNGKPLWSYKFQGDVLSAPTPTKHNQIYFMAGDVLYALNQTTGKEIWSNDLPKSNARPAVDDSSKRVYVGGVKNQLIALRPDSRVDWWLELNGKVSTPPLLAPDGYMYVVTDSGDVYKIKDRPN